MLLLEAGSLLNLWQSEMDLHPDNWCFINTSGNGRKTKEPLRY